MPLDFTLYAAPLYAGEVLIAGVVALAWQRRYMPVARHMIALCVLLMIYVGGYAMEISATTVRTAQFWLKVEYLGIPFASAALFTVVLVYTGNDQYVTLRNLALLLVIPATTTLLAWSGAANDLIWRDVSIDRSHGFTGTLFTGGTWYWVQMAYTYSLIASAALLLISIFRRTSGLYQRQIGAILIGMLAPMGANVAYMLDAAPPGLDLTPYGFIVTAVVAGFGMFYYQLFDVLPIAQETVVASMHDAVIVVDPLHRIIDVNPAAATLIGSPPESLAGRSIEMAFPTSLQAITAFALAEIEQSELTLPDQRSFDARSQPIRRHPRRADGYVLVLRDITARRRAEQEHLQLIAELDAFAQTVAHDLKNPLTVIGSYSMTLQEDLDQLPPAVVEEYIGYITQYTHKMTNIIDEMLLLATLRKMDTIKLRPLDMARIVAEAQERLVTLIESSGAAIVHPATWPAALGYASWVEEIWANYISNAIKYGGDPPRVELGSTPQTGGTIRFWVRDNGAGLTPEQQRQIFTPFIRLHEIRAEGHGLGLSIVDRIVHKLGGTAGVESMPGQGSSFYFTLPAAPAPSGTNHPTSRPAATRDERTNN